MTVAVTIAMPPIVGVGALCQRSGRGGTTAPKTGARRRTPAPTAIAVTVATRRLMSAITASGSGADQLGRTRRGAVSEDEGRPPSNPVADGIQSRRLAG